MPDPNLLRVGIVDYLNAWPLAWGFLSGEFDGEFDAVYLPPAEVADALAAGRIDLGLIPSIEARRSPGLILVEGLCVAATHEVRSVVLVSRGPLEAVHRVALDCNSRTSAALVRIILRERYDVEPQFEVASPDVEDMLSRADAALVIGDPALHIERSRYRVWDLAAEWRALTGRPFVFAVWAARPEIEGHIDRVTRRLAESLRLGLAQLPSIVHRAVDELGLEEAGVTSYLTKNLSYHLDREALEGLQEFYSRAAGLGLLPAPSGLHSTTPPGAVPSRPAEPGRHET